MSGNYAAAPNPMNAAVRQALAQAPSLPLTPIPSRTCSDVACSGLGQGKKMGMWLAIMGGAAAVLVLIVLFLVKRKKGKESADPAA